MLLDISVTPITSTILTLLSSPPAPAAAEHVTPAGPALYLDPQARRRYCGPCLRLGGIDPAGCRPATGACWSCADTRAATLASYHRDLEKTVRDLENRVLVLLDRCPTGPLLRLLGVLHYAVRRELPQLLAEVAVLIDRAEADHV